MTATRHLLTIVALLTPLASPQGTPARAPAPLPRAGKVAPRSPAGRWWHMNWGNGRFKAVFTVDGGYWCDTGGRPYTGSWRITDGGAVLELTEAELPRIDGDSWSWRTYRIVLEPGRGCLSGTLEGGSLIFRLEPAVPRASRRGGWRTYPSDTPNGR